MLYLKTKAIIKLDKTSTCSLTERKRNRQFWLQGNKVFVNFDGFSIQVYVGKGFGVMFERHI